MTSAYAKLYAMAMMGAVMCPDMFGFESEPTCVTDEERANLKRISEEKQRELKLSKGLKEFTIQGITVIALNEKNAKRKIAKIQKAIS